MHAPERRRSTGHVQLARATVFDMSPLLNVRHLDQGEPDRAPSRVSSRRHTFDFANHHAFPEGLATDDSERATAQPCLPSKPSRRRSRLRVRQETRRTVNDGDDEPSSSAAPLHGWVVSEAVRERRPGGSEDSATTIAVARRAAATAHAEPSRQLAAPPIARPHPPAVAASASRPFNAAAEETSRRPGGDDAASRGLKRPDEPPSSPTSVTCELPSSTAAQQPIREPVVAERVWNTITDDEEWQHIENLAGEWQHLDSAKQKQLLSKAIFGAALRCEARGAKDAWRATTTTLPALERQAA